MSLLSDWGNTCSWNYLIISNISKGKWGNKVVFFTVKYLTSLHMLSKEIFSSKIFFTFCTLLWFRFLMKTLVPLKFTFIKKYLTANSTLMFYFFFIQSILAACLATPAWWENSFEHFPHLHVPSTKRYFVLHRWWRVFAFSSMPDYLHRSRKCLMTSNIFSYAFYSCYSKT